MTLTAITGPAARAMLEAMIERSKQCGGRLLLTDEVLGSAGSSDLLDTFLEGECERSPDDDGWIIPTEKLEEVLRQVSLQ